VGNAVLAMALMSVYRFPLFLWKELVDEWRGKKPQGEEDEVLEQSEPETLAVFQEDGIELAFKCFDDFGILVVWVKRESVPPRLDRTRRLGEFRSLPFSSAAFANSIPPSPKDNGDRKDAEQLNELIKIWRKLLVEGIRERQKVRPKCLHSIPHALLRGTISSVERCSQMLCS
jgi:hypothetical protein